jgi:hypothetical protein
MTSPQVLTAPLEEGVAVAAEEEAVEAAEEAEEAEDPSVAPSLSNPCRSTQT